MKQSPIIFSLFGSNELTNVIQKKCHYELGSLTTHPYPDEETVIKIDSNVANRIVIFNANLNRPNSKLLPLLFAAETARSLGALKVVLIAPYLTYMRQDKVFEPGQGITSAYFAKLISHYFDALITIDPHLHRWHALSAYQMLLSSGAEKIITCNTIPHPSNAIDMSHDIIRFLITQSTFE